MDCILRGLFRQHSIPLNVAWRGLPAEVQQIVLHGSGSVPVPELRSGEEHAARSMKDRKSTRLNSSHTVISYAVFCLKKKTRINFRSLAAHPPASCLHDPRLAREAD